MWPSRVEIELYSDSYFDHITVFAKGGAHMHCVNTSSIHEFTYELHPFNALGSTVLQCVECSNVIKMRNRIMFNFYPGLPQMLSSSCKVTFHQLYL